MTEKDFSVYCPKVLAGISNDRVRWPDTIVDRSVVVRMKPRKRSEPIARMRRPRVREEVAPLCAQLERWASEHISSLQVAEPDWPDALDDRTCEAWDPLLAIADLAGGDIPQMARRAAVALQKGNDADDGQAGLMLLGALRGVFRDEHALSSEQICTAINKDDNLPCRRARCGWTRIRQRSRKPPEAWVTGAHAGQVATGPATRSRRQRSAHTSGTFDCGCCPSSGTGAWRTFGASSCSDSLTSSSRPERRRQPS